MTECGGPGCNPENYYLVWKTACNPNAGGNSAISRSKAWSNVGAWVQDGSSAAARVAVDTGGIPWVVQGSGSIFRRTTNNPATGSYQQLDNWAWDIGVSRAPYAWMTGDSETSNGFWIGWWNQQPGDSIAEPPAPAIAGQWTWFDSDGVEITVAPNGQPYLTSADGTIWTTNK